MTERARGLLAAAGLAVRRCRTAPGRWLPVAGAVAVAGGLAGGLAAAGAVAGDHAARRVLAAVPADQRPAVVSWYGGATPVIDRAARDALRTMGAGAVTHAILLYPTTFDRTVVRLGGIDRLGPAVRLRSGRLPRGGCSAARCEVLAVAGPAVPDRIAARGTVLQVVGRAALTAHAAFGFTTGGTVSAGGPAVLVAADPAGVERLPGLASVTRTQSWSAPLPLAALHARDLPAQRERIAAAQLALDRVAPGLTTSTPGAALALAQDRSRAAPGRLTTAGAVAAAALAAFLVLAAGGLRSGLVAEDARLRRIGATAGQRAALALVETAVPVLGGLVAGAVLAAVTATLRARAGGLAASPILHTALSDGIGPLLLAGAAAWALALLAARAPATLLRPLAGAALVAGAAALAGLLAPRDAAGDPLPGAVVPLAGAVAGLLAGLVAPAALRRLGRAASGRRPVARVSLLELAREPGAASLAAAGLAVSVGLAGFAFAYRATLERSRADQAAHRVALAATALPGPSLGSPLVAAPPAAWRALPGAGAVLPVVRRDGAALAGPTRDPVTVLGLPAAALPAIAAWRPRDAAGDRGRLALRLRAPPFDRPVAGLRLPGAARTVALGARADGDAVTVALVVRGADGLVQRVALGSATARPRTLRATLPRRARGGTAVAVEIAPQSGLLITASHQAAEGGGGAGAAAQGRLHLGALRAGGWRAPLVGWRGRAPLAGAPGALRYLLRGPALVRPDQPSDRAAIPVLADPATAADAAIAKGITLDVGGTQLRARVVGVLRRFPTVASGSGLVLADEAALSAGLDARTPGSGAPGELWLAARPGGEARFDAAAAGLARRAGLRLRTHAATRAAIDAEPVAREVLGALAAAAALAAALALLGVVVAVRRALREGAPALLDLETQGLGPSALRRGLRLRGAVIAVAGVVLGLPLAFLLTRLVTGAVRAGASGPPDPPLVAVVPWTSGLLAAAVLLLAAVALAALAVAGALREPVARATALGEGAS